MLALLLLLLCTTLPCVDEPTSGELQTWLDQQVSAQGPGAAVAVLRHGQTTVAVAGLADLATGAPLTRESRFSLASVSKAFSAAAVHLLARDGRLDLDDPIRRHLPELPAYCDPITVRHLIHHRSGLRDHLELMALAGWDLDAGQDMRQALELVLRQGALNHPPGSEMSYCNTGYLLLALIVERVSGHSLGEFAEERLFAPLGMSATRFREEADDVQPLDVRGHDRLASGHAPRVSAYRLVGSGGVWAPVDDLLRWVVALQGDGEVLPSELVADLETVWHATPDQGLDPHLGPYAAGWFVDTRNGRRELWHHGGSFGFSAAVIRWPDEGQAVVVLTNAADGGAMRLAAQAARRWTPAAGAPPVSEAEPAETLRVADFQGLFRHPRTNELLIAKVQQGRAKVACSSWDLAMRPVTPTTLVSIDSVLPLTAELLSGADGPHALQLTIGDQTPFRCAPVPLDMGNPRAAEGLAGSWYAPELDAEISLRQEGIQIVVEGGLLVVDGALFPLATDLLSTNEGFRMEVRRDTDGEPVELRVSTRRAHDIRFVRPAG